jgi:hypothetical protein
MRFDIVIRYNDFFLTWRDTGCVTEAVERAALVAEAEGCATIEGTHLERILPQLLLDF